MVRQISLLLPFILAAVSSSSPAPLPLIIETRYALSASSPANIHIYPRSHSTSYSKDSELKVSYGPCESTSPHDSTHKHITFTSCGEAYSGDNRWIWIVPEDAPSGGCLSAWETSSGRLLARSAALDVGNDLQRRRLGKRITMGPENGIDPNGPWFDGVELLKSTGLTSVQVTKAKSKKIGIVGGGMAGLMTGLLLDSQGMTNWKILEASDRIGGRIRTHHFSGPNDYQYQEMGPMRFPEEVYFRKENVTLPVNDHKLVFDLATYLNNKNKNATQYLISWIPWYQTNANRNNLVYMGGIRKKDGTVPTQKDIDADPSLEYKPGYGAEVTAELESVTAEVQSMLFTDEQLMAVAENMFQAHKEFIEDGLDDFSEFAFLRNELETSLNVTDIAGGDIYPYWEAIFDTVWFNATKWRTIDHGLQRLADAFTPLLNGRIDFSRWVGKSSWDAETKKVTLGWKSKWSDKAYTDETFDYAVVAAPFSMVRSWRFSPMLPSLINRAQQNLRYKNACKVALHFKSRFWERPPNPIYGGCSATDLEIVGNFCYPSYAINSTGPGVLLASYTRNQAAHAHLAYSDEEHASRVLDAIAEIHGETLVRSEYTGQYARECWPIDEYAHGAWADPVAGQHSLYIPEFYRTTHGNIWVGEHTGFTHGWIAAAVESAIRGVVQLLLEEGLVDEAKAVTEEWMGRWISV